jgi:hypothetical protein
MVASGFNSPRLQIFHDRPEVIHNSRTKQFVMWFHLELWGKVYEAARSGVAVADKPTGPYRFLESLRPNPSVWPLVPGGFTGRRHRSLSEARAGALGRWARAGAIRAAGPLRAGSGRHERPARFRLLRNEIRRLGDGRNFSSIAGFALAGRSVGSNRDRLIDRDRAQNYCLAKGNGVCLSERGNRLS